MNPAETPEDPINRLQDYEFTLEAQAGMYKANFEALQIEATVERIRASHDHEVKAELVFTSRRALSAGHLRQSRVNITSGTARNSMAKSLHARDPDIDWDKVLEQLCVAVLKDWRQGSPAVQLNQDPEIKNPNSAPRWLVNPIVQTNNPTLIFGEGSAGKSWLAQFIAVCVDEGIDACGLTITPEEKRIRPSDDVVRPANVLYLDWETDINELEERITKIRRGLGLEGGSHIWYRQMGHGLAVDIEAVGKLVDAYNISLVVVDSVGSAMAGEPESADVVLQAFAALRGLKTSSLLIDHTNRAGEIFGSVYKKNASRQMFEIKSERNASKISVGMFHRKSNNSPLLSIPIGIEITFVDEDTVTFIRRDIRDTALEENLALMDRVVNRLWRQGPAPIQDLALAFNTSENVIRKTISNDDAKRRRRMLGSRVQSIGGGQYAATSHREEEYTQEESSSNNTTYLE